MGIHQSNPDDENNAIEQEEQLALLSRMLKSGELEADTTPIFVPENVDEMISKTLFGDF